MIYAANKIEPAHDFILVERVDTKSTPSGIVLPQAKDQESKIGKIIAIGPGLDGKQPPQCKPGEYWIMARFIGEKINVDGHEYQLVKWYDCLAKIHWGEQAMAHLDA